MNSADRSPFKTRQEGAAQAVSESLDAHDGVISPGAKADVVLLISKVVLTLAFFYIATENYLTAAINVASRTPFWSDEVLAVWVARLPTVSEITKAIWQGAEFSPPTYDIFLHFIFEGFGSSPLVARLPSIIAILCTAIAVAWIVWRRLGALSSALAFGFILNSPLFAFAVQARPYAILVAFVSLILLLWSGHGRGALRPTAIGALLVASMSIHIYSVVIFFAFSIMEVLTSVRSSIVRLEIWVALVAAGLSSLIWLPLVLHLSTFNSGDTASPDFYGAPTLSHLIEHFDALFRGSPVFGLVLLTALLLIACTSAASFMWQTSTTPRSAHSTGDGDTAIMAAGLLATLPVGFLLALAATHVFSARYALPATIGAVLLVVLGLARVPFARLIGGVLCAILAVLPILRGVPPTDAATAISLLGDNSAPVLVSDSNLFIELMEDAPPALRDHLVHATKPPGVADGDTSADHQLQRLVSSFRPDLPVVDPKLFFANHSQFTELCRPTLPTDVFCAWLIKKYRVQGFVKFGGRVAVLEINTGSDLDHP